MNTLLLNANALSIPLASGSVQCVVTSPPYWSLRNYNVDGQLGLEPLHDCTAWARGDEPCGACYVCQMRAVFAEVWRVLRDDGTLWLNLGDSYNGSGGAGGDYNPGGLKDGQPKYPGHKGQGLKAKDLCGIPWRVALALQSDGWYLRSDIIWAKRAPMPESVTDRPTKAHEQIFLLTKSARYYYDAEAVREGNADPDRLNLDASRSDHYTRPFGTPGIGRNQRDVWTLGPEPYAGAHFATFVTEIPRRAIKAGTSERGACPACGKAWERVIEKGYRAPAEEDVIAAMIAKGVPRQKANLYGSPSRDPKLYAANPDRFMGWKPACTCNAGEPVPCIVLDPFNGSGTTGMVAQELGRRYVGLDLSADYLKLAQDRLGHTALKNWERGRQAPAADLGPLFNVTMED